MIFTHSQTESTSYLYPIPNLSCLLNKRLIPSRACHDDSQGCHPVKVGLQCQPLDPEYLPVITLTTPLIAANVSRLQSYGYVISTIVLVSFSAFKLELMDFRRVFVRRFVHFSFLFSEEIPSLSHPFPHSCILLFYQSLHSRIQNVYSESPRSFEACGRQP